MSEPDPKEQERIAALQLLVENLEVHSAHCLKIKDKAGVIRPFIWNKAQRYIHERLELQLKATGMVRALILKGRQQGASTYIGARFYQKSSMRPGKGAFIVAHEQKATNNLYGMVRRYHDHNPLAPSTSATNAQELIFDRLDGGYKLATAGTKDVGRSNTAQFLHGSEYGFWANAQSHLAGIGNTIGDIPGTEIILESTANGLGNSFHTMWQDAERGCDEDGNPFPYIAIFVPWFWQEEYVAPVQPTLKLSKEDLKYQAVYGLTAEQMQWRANKIASYGKGYAWLFDQEYPATPALAFQSATMNPLISPQVVMSAVNSGYAEMHGPLIIGCDPAGDGAASKDRTAIAFRRGRVCFRIEYHNRLNTMQVAGKLAEYWRDMGPDAIFVDKGGLGAGIVDRLNELNIPVIGVNNGETARNPEIFDNRAAEMWWAMLDWFDDAPCRIPNDPALISDLVSRQPGSPTSKGLKQLESKREMQKRGIRSPDGGDALALTFADPVTHRVGSSTSSDMQLPRGKSGPASNAGY